MEKEKVDEDGKEKGPTFFVSSKRIIFSSGVKLELQEVEKIRQFSFQLMHLLPPTSIPPPPPLQTA